MAQSLTQSHKREPLSAVHRKPRELAQSPEVAPASPRGLPAELWATVHRLVAEAPAMTDDQRANIVALFRAGEHRTA